MAGDGERELRRWEFYCVLAPGIMLAQGTNGQVTYGKKPQLPAPFATKSAGKSAGRIEAAEGISADSTGGSSRSK